MNALIQNIFFKVCFIVIIFNINVLKGIENSPWRLVDSVLYATNSFDTDYIFFNSVDCADNSNCIAFGNMSEVWPWNRETTDGGLSWFTTLIDTTSTDGKNVPMSIVASAYPDTSLCIAVCCKYYIWRSTDKGFTWQKVPYPGYQAINAPFIFNISMLNKNFGGISTPTELYLTEDGGLNWNLVTITLPDSLMPKYFYDLKILNENLILLVAFSDNRNYYILRSKDKGNTWEACEPTAKPMKRIYFLNEKEGWGCGKEPYQPYSELYNDYIFHTTDGGYSWIMQLDTFCFPQTGLNQIIMYDSLSGFAFGSSFNFWSTVNGGKTWYFDKSFCNFSGWSGYGSITIIKKLLNNKKIGLNEMGYIYISEPKTNIYEKNFLYEKIIAISPNPASDFIKITGLSENDNWEIFNVLGIRMCGNENNLTSSPSPKEERDARIDVSTFPPGVYFLQAGGKVCKFLKY